MSMNHIPQHLPDYTTFVHSIAVLALPISGSTLHGVMCGYLSAGATREGEAYLRTLTMNKTNENTRSAALSLFSVYAVSQQQMGHLGFDFQLLLPDDDEPLPTRAQAFSEWCSGFTQGIALAGIDCNQLQDEDAQEAIQHLNEFSQLDYHSLHVDTENEQALMEVCEYTRMAVLHIHSDVHTHKVIIEDSEKTH